MDNTNNKTEILNWGKSSLDAAGFSIQGEFEKVRVVPWSQVYCANTQNGRVFLKHMSKPFSLEANIIEYLAQRFKDWVPHIIAKDNQLDCFLMLDAGEPLRDSLKQKYQVTLPIHGLREYCKIQKVTAQCLDDLFKIGLQDWRMEKFADLVDSLLDETDTLVNDGLSSEEINQLKALIPALHRECEQLAQFKIPSTIDHCDFHDNNMLIKNRQLIINDWGDTIITHPFFSLVSFLSSASRNHQILPESQKYKQLKEAYLDGWSDFESERNIFKVYDIVEKIGSLRFVLSFYRVTQCPGMKDLDKYKGTIASGLRNYLQAHGRP